MKRRLLNLLTALSLLLTVLSLLLCVAVAVLWVRSYRVADVWERSTDGGYVAFELRIGEFLWRQTEWDKIRGAFIEAVVHDGRWIHSTRLGPLPALSKRLRREGATPSGWFNVAGILYGRQEDDTLSDATGELPSSVLAIPMWLALLLV